jgi:HD-GYP domain-containing protein (c-di-GMP phosphodiesterase class II)
MALDFAEKEFLQTSIFHSKRVAYISLRIARQLQLSDEECFDIVSLALMHDNGLSEAISNQKVKDDTITLDQVEQIKDHCIIGQKNVENFPFLTPVKDVVLYHHEHYDGSGFFGKKADQIPLAAQIIALSDEIEFNFDLDDFSVHNENDIINFIQENSAKRFDPKLVDIFLELSRLPSFWLDLQKITINQALKDYLPTFTIEISWEEILKITSIFTIIVDAKSSFTYRHTRGLIEKIEKLARFYDFEEEKIIKLKIAASLHDLGKLAVPNRMIDKNAPLNEEEFNNMKIHTYYTHHMLQNIENFEDIEKWAYSHHETLDGKGYPFGLDESKLDFESRMMTCLDIYQALTEERPYRESLLHTEAMKILNNLVTQGKIDPKITQDIEKVFS